MVNNNTLIYVMLGAIILVLVGISTYVFAISKPGLSNEITIDESKGSPVLTTEDDDVTSSSSTTNGSTNTGGFQLSDAQVNALIELGIDPQAVPSSISAEQEICFIDALGETRVNEIKAGAVPNAIEFLKAKSCI